MNCMVCGAGPAAGATIHRVSPKGDLGVWVCERHLGTTDIVVDRDVRRVVDAISGDHTVTGSPETGGEK